MFLGSRRSDYGQFKYKLPDNVVHFEEHFLYDGLAQPRARATKPRSRCCAAS